MLSAHEFECLIDRLNNQRRAIDVNQLKLEAQELRSLLKRVKRVLKDEREIMNDLSMIKD